MRSFEELNKEMNRLNDEFYTVDWHALDAPDYVTAKRYDFIPADLNMPTKASDMRYPRSEEYVVEECKKLVDQLILVQKRAHPLMQRQ
jgi:hypothetical protein